MGSHFKALLLGICSMAVLLSAIAVVYCKHLSRQLFSHLQQRQHAMEALQEEWAQLLLEQQTWAADARVEQVARSQLRMKLPQPDEIVVITQ